MLRAKVVHAGIYYKSGSQKAKLCVRGRKSLYSYCQERGIATRMCGKLIVATSENEVCTLGDILDQAVSNGVSDLVLLGPADVQAIEPEVKAVRGIFSPSTGIVDSHALMNSLLSEAEQHGAAVAFNTRVLGGQRGQHTWVVRAADSNGSFEIECEGIVNCSGLEASETARALGCPPKLVPETFFAKGNYYSLRGKAPFSRLVYPVPEQSTAGLGVHATVDLGGRVRFGPDVEWVSDRRDLRVDPSRSEGFYREIRKYWPGLRDGTLEPDYCGIRPKLHGPGHGGSALDFTLQGRHVHGLKGLVNCFGIESPGLTASLALAEEVERLLDASK